MSRNAVELQKIYDSLYHMRYSGAMNEGEDLRTNLICVTNSLLSLMSYMLRCENGQGQEGNNSGGPGTD